MFPQLGEIGIPLQPLEVAVAQIEGVRDFLAGALEQAVQSEAARVVETDARVVRAELA